MAGHYIVTGDGGMGIFGSPANPTGNTSVSLPIGQMYRVTVNQRFPYWLYSDRQDDGSVRACRADGQSCQRTCLVCAATAPNPNRQPGADAVGVGRRWRWTWSR